MSRGLLRLEGLIALVGASSVGYSINKHFTSAQTARWYDYGARYFGYQVLGPTVRHGSVKNSGDVARLHVASYVRSVFPEDLIQILLR